LETINPFDEKKQNKNKTENTLTLSDPYPKVPSPKVPSPNSSSALDRLNLGLTDSSAAKPRPQLGPVKEQAARRLDLSKLDAGRCANPRSGNTPRQRAVLLCVVAVRTKRRRRR